MADNNTSFDSNGSQLDGGKQPEVFPMTDEQVKEMFSVDKRFQRLANKYQWTDEQKEEVFNQGRLWATEISSHQEFNLDRSQPFLKISLESETMHVGHDEE